MNALNYLTDDCYKLRANLIINMLHGEIKKSKYDVYQICVTIIEAKYLEQNKNPMVVVKIGNKKKRTMVQERTDNPYFNEYFVFDFVCDFDTLLGMRIIIAVYLKTACRRMRFHGSIMFEVATVWDQPGHQVYHKWALLTDPQYLDSKVKGYVKCNILVNARGQRVKIPQDTDGEDDIERNLLLPTVGKSLPYRQWARYIFTIYRADGLPEIPPGLFGRGQSDNLNSFIQISFAGMKGSTNDVQRTCNPRYNEMIIFKEIFPPMCHRMRIILKHRFDNCGSSSIAVCSLNIGQISDSEEYGFLPTYGPSFVYFYGSGSIEKNSCSSKCSRTPLPLYRGRVLLSLKTEIDDPEVMDRSTTIQVQPTLPIVEKTLWKSEEYLLVGVLYDASMIDRTRFSKKPISFELSFGNVGNRQYSSNQWIEDDEESDSENQIKEQVPIFDSHTEAKLSATLDDKYNCLSLGSKKPCVYVKSWWPNVEGRIYNSNRLLYIVQFLETSLEKVEGLGSVEHPTAYETFNETIRTLKTYCTDYLHSLEGTRHEQEGATTRLDRNRVNVCRKQIQSILKKLEITGELPNNHYIKIAMLHAHRYLTLLRQLWEDPQHGLPDVFIWMMAGSKRVACSRLSAREIIYSEEITEKGSKCGQRINLFLKRPEDEFELHERVVVACKIEILVWLGNAKFASGCWSTIPPGYEIDNENTVDSVPRFLEYHIFSTYQLRAHVFQGHFDPGMDASGLMDPLVYVTFQEYTISTSAIKQSLDPFWDQTLVFPTLTLYGTRQHMKSSPPGVVLQVFDQDPGGNKEFCGRCIAIPIVKLTDETYSLPDFPPKLAWYKFETQKDCSGSILAAFELIEVGEGGVAEEPIKSISDDKIYNIPEDIRPKMTTYRLEVIFWGVRGMKRMNCIPVNKPRIVLECAGVHIKSEVMENAKKFSNYEDPRVLVELEMPELDIYYPSVTIKAYDSRGFGYFKYVGVCIIPTIYVFLETLITEEEYHNRIYERENKHNGHEEKSPDVVLPLSDHYDSSNDDESTSLIPYKKIAAEEKETGIFRMFKATKKYLKLEGQSMEDIYISSDNDENLDWWCKYYASLKEWEKKAQGIEIQSNPLLRKIATFEFYSEELELQPQFGGFQDRLTTFELKRGKKRVDRNYHEENLVGNFKGHISVYRWPHPENLPCKTRSGRDVADGLCDDYPTQEPVKLLVRIYVIKGINLQPCDPTSGKSDPYLVIKLGKHVINDEDNFLANQLNPTFGRLFEIEAVFPRDYLLVIQVWDRDFGSADDLMGETRIDIENRFYSRHYGKCGIAKTYDSTGYNGWRDREKPTQILELLCRKNNLPAPEYGEEEVKIANEDFRFHTSIGEPDREEHMALNVLHHWEQFPLCGHALVPEHVERRPLFNPKRAGFEQGKLELWVDMFPEGELPLKPAVNITPILPEEYEIRAIIWNTENVPLVESQFLTGEKCSDIYVKGWILYEDYQKTDVHYNSLTGEGNFNWRFVFRVTYAKGENVMLIYKKISMFARNETEQKLPCKLNLQVWDSDHYSPDDFLGGLTLDLSNMPRGSPNSHGCTLKLLDPKVATINLFRVTRTKGWWPFFHTAEDGKIEQAGKVELELSVTRGKEADEQPVGKGRNPPENLPKPNRPETSFSWFRNPWKALVHGVCRRYRAKILCCVFCVLFVLLIATGIYSAPRYIVKRIIGA